MNLQVGFVTGASILENRVTEKTKKRDIGQGNLTV